MSGSRSGNFSHLLNFIAQLLGCFICLLIFVLRPHLEVLRVYARLCPQGSISVLLGDHVWCRGWVACKASTFLAVLFSPEPASGGGGGVNSGSGAQEQKVSRTEAGGWRPR